MHNFNFKTYKNLTNNIFAYCHLLRFIKKLRLKMHEKIALSNSLSNSYICT